MKRVSWLGALSWMLTAMFLATSVSMAANATGWTNKSSGGTFQKTRASRPDSTWLCPAGHQVSHKPGKCLTCGQVMQKKMGNQGGAKSASPNKK